MRLHRSRGSARSPRNPVRLSHYGHLARDGREHAIQLLDEPSAYQRPRWTLVDAAWTSKLVASASVDNESLG